MEQVKDWPDIAKEIINIFYKYDLTYNDAERVIEWVNGEMNGQKVQPFDISPD